MSVCPTNYYYYVLADDEDGNWSGIPTATSIQIIDNIDIIDIIDNLK